MLTVQNLSLSLHCWPEASGPGALRTASWAVLHSNCLNMHRLLACKTRRYRHRVCLFFYTHRCIYTPGLRQKCNFIVTKGGKQSFLLLRLEIVQFRVNLTVYLCMTPQFRPVLNYCFQEEMLFDLIDFYEFK